jgi:hypothetical protein
MHDIPLPGEPMLTNTSSLKSLGLLSLVSSTVSGCIFQDTCNKGETFNDLTLGSEFIEEGEGDISLLIEWSLGSKKGADLPDAYFEAALPSSCVGRSDDCIPSITDVAYSGPQQFKVWFPEDVKTTFADSNLEFFITFSDREDYIDCTHPGAGDYYTLNVSLTLDAQGEIIDSNLYEYLYLGPI